MTTAEKMAIAAVKPFLPMLSQRLGPMLEQFIDGELADTKRVCPRPNEEPIIVISQRGDGEIFVMEGYLSNREITGLRRRFTLAQLAKMITDTLAHE